MLRFALVAVVTIPLLAGCTAVPGPGPSVSATSTSAAPSAVASSTAPANPTPSADPSASPVTTVTPVATATSAAAAGCANGRTAIPAGARTEKVMDIDGDGRSDTAFFTTSKPYEFGFATAAGGVYTTADLLPSGGAHHAWTTFTDGFPGRAIVLDDGVVATPLSFRDCRIRAITTSDGSPLTVPIGAHDASGNATTGVACNDQNGGILIESVQLRARSTGRYDVVWSTLEPDGTFSGVDVRYTDLAASDPRVAQARTSTCWAAHTLTVTH